MKTKFDLTQFGDKALSTMCTVSVIWTMLSKKSISCSVRNLSIPTKVKQSVIVVRTMVFKDHGLKGFLFILEISLRMYRILRDVRVGKSTVVWLAHI